MLGILYSKIIWIYCILLVFIKIIVYMFSNVFFFYFIEVDYYLYYLESIYMVIEFYLNSLVYID